MFLQSKQLLSFEYANACKGILFNGPSGITIILSYLWIKFGNKKFKKTNLVMGIFFYFIAAVQLMDYFLS